MKTDMYCGTNFNNIDTNEMSNLFGNNISELNENELLELDGGVASVVIASAGLVSFVASYLVTAVYCK